LALEMRPRLCGRSRRSGKGPAKKLVLVLEDGPEISFWCENVAKNANGHAAVAIGGAGAGTGGDGGGGGGDGAGDGPAHDIAKIDTASRSAEFAVGQPKSDRV